MQYHKKTTPQSTEYRVQSTDYRLQITEYRVQITDYRVQITEYRLQSTDYRRVRGICNLLSVINGHFCPFRVIGRSSRASLH